MIRTNYDDFGMIGRRLISDSDVSNLALSVYAVTRTMFFCVNKSCSIINLNNLYDVFGVNNSQSTQTTPIQEALKELVDLKLIELYDINNNKILFKPKHKHNSRTIIKISYLFEDEENMFIGEGGFVRIPETNLTKLMEFVNKKNRNHRDKLIKYYLIISKYCANDNAFATISYGKIKNDLNIAKDTFYKWNKQLIDLGIFYMDSNYGYITKVGKLRRFGTMVYHRNYLGLNANKSSDLDKFNGLINQIVSNPKYYKINNQDKSNLE